MKPRIRKLQIARRLVQLSVIALLLAIPAVSRYGNFLAARELDKTIEKWDGTLQGETLAALDLAFRALPGGEKERAGEMVRDRTSVLAFAQTFRGGPWSVQMGSLSMTDPLGALESAIARKKVVPVLMIGLIIPLIVTFLLGRVFCSWICPMHLILECTDRLRSLLKFAEIQPKNIRFTRATKYVLLAVGIFIAAVFSMPILSYIYPPAILNREGHDLVFGIFDRAEAGHFGFWMGGLTWMSLLVVGVALFEMFVSRRWWCRYMCPGGAVYSILGAFRPIRVKLKAAKCTQCVDCVVVCPVGLNPMKNEMGMECDNCGLCISHCGDKALAYGLSILPRSETQPMLATRIAGESAHAHDRSVNA